MLVLTHGTTRLPEIPSESMCFQWIRWTPSDDFPTLLKVVFTLPVSSYDYTSSNSSGLYCTSGFIFRLDSVGLQVLSTGIWSRVWTCVDRYILCPKPPYPAEKTLGRRQLFFLAVPPWPVIKILCPSRTIFSAWRWSSD